MSDHFEFVTPRCRIRPAVISDLPALERSVGSPEFSQQLPLARIYAEGKLSHWLERFCAYETEPRLWSITTQSSSECIGQIGLIPESDPGTYWLSYWLAPAYWGRGITKECIAALLRQGTSERKYKMLVAAVAQSNQRSISVLHGLGFKQTSSIITRSHIPEDHLCFALEFNAGDVA